MHLEMISKFAGFEIALGHGAILPRGKWLFQES